VPVIIGIIADAVAQYLIFDHVRLIPAVIVGSLVTGIPYAVIRGLTNRAMSAWNRTREDSGRGGGGRGLPRGSHAPSPPTGN
jgi:hypothetical protein